MVCKPGSCPEVVADDGRQHRQPDERQQPPAQVLEHSRARGQAGLSGLLRVASVQTLAALLWLHRPAAQSALELLQT